jgi:hypothetical protein
MCHLCGAAVPEGPTASKHRCSSIREENDHYRYCSKCYTGEFRLSTDEEPLRRGGTGIVPGEKVYLEGSWDAYKGLVEMEHRPGATNSFHSELYVGEIVLGDTLSELFHIVVKKGKNEHRFLLHPIAKKAGQQVRIAGPSSDQDASEKFWLLDGRRDKAAEGSVYRIFLEVGEFARSITWLPTGEVRVPEVKEGSGHHKYCMASSIANWVPWQGTRDYEDDPNVTNFFKGKIPPSGRLEFVLMRDFDKNQMIYPLDSRPTTGSTPICGPDEGGDGKRWSVHGREGETVYGSFTMKEGEISFSVKTASMGELKFTGTTARHYSVIGSWNKEVPDDMEPVPGVYDLWRYQFVIGSHGYESFQILVNKNLNLRMYPERDRTAPGECIACGPDRKGNKKHWEVQGPPGQVFELTLDFGAEDFCEKLSCWPVSA